MRLSISPAAASAIPTPMALPRGITAGELAVEEISFARLHGEHEIDRIRYLREEIALPDDVRNGSDFQDCEKKEIFTAWSAPSNSAAT